MTAVGFFVLLFIAVLGVWFAVAAVCLVDDGVGAGVRARPACRAAPRSGCGGDGDGPQHGSHAAGRKRRRRERHSRSRRCSLMWERDSGEPVEVTYLDQKYRYTLHGQNMSHVGLCFLGSTRLSTQTGSSCARSTLRTSRSSSRLIRA